VGYSGGADSTALVHLLHLAEVDVVAAHLHHGQRPEAEKELENCQSFAESLGITVPRLECENRWIYAEYKDGQMVGGHYQWLYRYKRIRRYYWGDEITAGEWKPTKKEAKASYKEALRQRREREKQATQAVA
jgi:hypothetical protein